MRRIAFGQSETRSLRSADLQRLLKLQLIKEGRDTFVLTISGREHFESLPRTVFASRARQDAGS